MKRIMNSDEDPHISPDAALPPWSRKFSLARPPPGIPSRLNWLKMRRRRESADKDVTHGKQDDKCAMRLDDTNPTIYLPTGSNEGALGELLWSLPVELQREILSYMDMSTILSLRGTSKILYSLVDSNWNEISRCYVAYEFPSSCRNLCRQDRNFSVQYTFQLHHVHTTAVHVAQILADFVEAEVLKDVGEQLYDDTRAHFVETATPQLIVLAHFYRTVELWMLYYFKRCGGNGWLVNKSSIELRPSLDAKNARVPLLDIFCGNKVLQDDQASTMSLCDFVSEMIRKTYNVEQLTAVHSMERFLTSSLRRLLRPASYLSFIERMPRHGKNTIDEVPAIESVESLLVIGGLDVARRVFSKKSYSQRFDEMARWRRSLQKSECMRWAENWKAAIYGPFADKCSADLSKKGHLIDDPLHNPPVWFNPDWVGLWSPAAYALLRLAGRFPEPKSTRSMISELVGYDILRSTRWAE